MEIYRYCFNYIDNKAESALMLVEEHCYIEKEFKGKDRADKKD